LQPLGEIVALKELLGLERIKHSVSVGHNRPFSLNVGAGLGAIEWTVNYATFWIGYPPDCPFWGVAVV